MGWGPEESRWLMEIILEMSKPGVPSALRWDRVVAAYNARHKGQVSVKQAQNHFSQCRYKWVAWQDMNSMTGIELVDGLPTEAELGSERFKQFFEKHKKGGLYVARHKLHDLDIWGPIFAGKCATGALSFSPASAVSGAAGRKRANHGKDPIVGEEVEGSGDSDDCRETEAVPPIPESLDSSRSPPRTRTTKRRKRCSTSASAVSVNLDKALDIMRFTDHQLGHEKKLYRAVKSMAEVRQRGVSFQNKVMVYLVERKLDKLFVEFENDEEKWDLIQHLASDTD